MTYSLNIPSIQRAPIVLSAPHCGINFPDEFISQSPLSIDALLETADIGTNRLVDSIDGVLAIKAQYARSFVDLNRARHQLDKSVIDKLDIQEDLQTRSGYGVIPRYARHGVLTHSQKINLDEAEERLATYYDPYHKGLQKLLDKTIAKFGHVILIDVHSAPAHLLGDVDVQIGTLHGQSCAPELIEHMIKSFEDNGLKVGLEVPFAGGHITQCYMQQATTQTLQIEVSRRHCVDHQNTCIIDLDNSFLTAWQDAISDFMSMFI